MKKVALFVAACMLAAPVDVYACVDGVEFAGRNNATYCVSNITMNWWSAFAWCQAQGYSLATFERACPDATELLVDVANSWNCGNISTNGSVGGAWLARAWQDANGNSKALHLGGSGCSNICRYKIDSVNRTAKYKALCIE